MDSNIIILVLWFVVEFLFADFKEFSNGNFVSLDQVFLGGLEVSFYGKSNCNG